MSRGKKKKGSFRYTLKEYFSFSYRVKRGLLVLYALIFFEVLALIYLHYLPSSAQSVNDPEFQKAIDAFYAAQESDSAKATATDSAATDNFSFRKKNVSPDNFEMFVFNPNNLSQEKWKRLGFSDRQIASIRKFESKGGTFRTKADVKKMYAIHDSEFKRIAPYIDLPDSIASEHRVFEKKKPAFLVVDISIADTSDFNKLPMVGDFLAMKISSYRERLGGFHSIDQIKEVRGLRDSTYALIAPHLVLKDSTNLRKINLNEAGYEELNRHPYINSTVASVIVAYRAQHGRFEKVEDIQKVSLVDAELYRKIAPYLKVE